MSIILKLEEIHKSYGKAAVLKGISFQLHQGQTMAITGKSGEGKSTLLQIIGTLENPTSGYLEICGKSPLHYLVHELRNQHIGFIFQSFNLLDEYSVIENLLMPQKIARKNCSKNSPSYTKACHLLEEMELLSKEHILAKFLSGGEKQRVAIARALCNDPDLILADEPTGNLDRENSQKVQQLLIQSAKKWNKALIIATHDQELAQECDVIYSLKDGLLSSVLHNSFS